MPQASVWALARGVNRSTIREAIRDRRIRVTNGMVDPKEADATWYRRHLLRNDGQRSGAEIAARHEQALKQSVAAKIVITRRKVEAKRLRMIERNKGQADVTTAAGHVGTQVSVGVAKGDVILSRAIKSILDDLADVEQQSLRVTR